MHAKHIQRGGEERLSGPTKGEERRGKNVLGEERPVKRYIFGAERPFSVDRVEVSLIAFFLSLCLCLLYLDCSINYLPFFYTLKQSNMSAPSFSCVMSVPACLNGWSHAHRSGAPQNVTFPFLVSLLSSHRY